MVGVARKHPHIGVRVRLDHAAVAFGVSLKGADRAVKIGKLSLDLQRCIHQPHFIVEQRQYRIVCDCDTVGQRKATTHAIKDTVSSCGDSQVFRIVRSLVSA